MDAHNNYSVRSVAGSAAPLVVFDGICNLCTGSVKFILRHEAMPKFMFVPIQSATGRKIANELGVDLNDVKTFIVIADNNVYVRSQAAIHIARQLRWPWRLLGAIRFIPGPIRDWAYGIVASRRYLWFGRSTSCMVPTRELEARFIQD